MECTQAWAGSAIRVSAVVHRFAGTTDPIAPTTAQVWIVDKAGTTVVDLTPVAVVDYDDSGDWLTVSAEWVVPEGRPQGVLTAIVETAGALIDAGETKFSVKARSSIAP